MKLIDKILRRRRPAGPRIDPDDSGIARGLAALDGVLAHLAGKPCMGCGRPAGAVVAVPAAGAEMPEFPIPVCRRCAGSAERRAELSGRLAGASLVEYCDLVEAGPGGSHAPRPDRAGCACSAVQDRPASGIPGSN